MTERIFVDSNVWVYLFASEDNQKSKIGEYFILENSIKHTLVISYQVINEVANVLIRKKFDEYHIRYVIESMFKMCVIQDYSKHILFLASVLREKHRFSFWDSLIVATALTSQCHCLVSEDMQHNQIIEGMTIKNIFKS
jgi:predicted nucleic acid-binding protein